MRFVSPTLRRIIYPGLAGMGVFRRMARPGLAVLTYHGVLPQGYEPADPALDGNLVSAETLRRQLRLLKSNYHVITPEDLLMWCRNEHELPPRSVLLTCDDGLQNNLTDMLPILREEGVRCLFFVTGASAAAEPALLWYEELFLILLAARIGPFAIRIGGVEIHGELGEQSERQKLWWSAVKHLSKVDAKSRQELLCAAHAQLGGGDGKSCSSDDSPWRRRFHLLRRSELVKLESPGMTIGAHTVSHPLLSQSPPDLARAEIVNCRSLLEEAIGKQVWAFAYPFGDAESVTPEVVSMVEQAGYEAAFLNIGGGLGAGMPRFAIPRIHVTAAMNLGEFEARVAGFHASLERWVRRDGQHALPQRKAQTRAG